MRDKFKANHRKSKKNQTNVSVLKKEQKKQQQNTILFFY